MVSQLDSILKHLENQDITVINSNSIGLINTSALSILNKQEHTQNDIVQMGLVIRISNILYNNTDKDLLPLDDGVYDLLLELYKKYNPMYQVGAEPIVFSESAKSLITAERVIRPIKRIDKKKCEDFLFMDELSKKVDYNIKDLILRPVIRTREVHISKRLVNTKHTYPELVGTLDKCKFVMNYQAIEKGVANDSNVKILERDFYAKHISDGILDPRDVFTSVFELKYDGISVEAEVNSKVISAKTRGDANEDIAADITPILYGYEFHQAKGIIPDDEVFGMKFEAIMTYSNLCKYNELKGKDYKNCRTAIAGLFASSDAHKYRDLITLVPLATSLGIDRLSEIEFMNKFYHSGELLRYAVVRGDYTQTLYQAKRFTEEAEYIRPFLPFMYDGVVISYIDDYFKQRLGRVNAVNKYSIAVKFNPLKKNTIFRGFTYSVGQDGSITPMIHYDPVEFYGTIHNKSTGSSLDRFLRLGLKQDDIISVEYVNDVMPYVSKPENTHNDNNPNPVIEFILDCPSCGSKLKLSKSGKTMYCDNINCPERNLNRMVAMMQKLNLKDFSESYLSQINRYSLSELMSLTIDDVKFLGGVTSQKFIERMNELRTKDIYDYQIIGSLGFTGIGRRKWKLILNKYTLNELLEMNQDLIKYNLMNIKGVGPMTADIIMNEFDFFRNDLVTINNMSNIINTKGIKTGKDIRLTGFRDSQLIEQLNDMGHDAGEGSVTKKTDILLIPYETFTSSKTKKAMDIGTVQIVPVKEFVENMNQYLD